MNVIPQSPPIRIEVKGPLLPCAVGDPHGDGQWHTKGWIVAWAHNPDADELTPYIWNDGDPGAGTYTCTHEIFVINEPVDPAP